MNKKIIYSLSLFLFSISINSFGQNLPTNVAELCSVNRNQSTAIPAAGLTNVGQRKAPKGTPPSPNADALKQAIESMEKHKDK